jgi:hypothetical protein
MAIVIAGMKAVSMKVTNMKAMGRLTMKVAATVENDESNNDEQKQSG